MILLVAAPMATSMVIDKWAGGTNGMFRKGVFVLIFMLGLAMG